MILLIILFLTGLAFNIWYDQKQIKNVFITKRGHQYRTYLRGVLFFVNALIFFWGDFATFLELIPAIIALVWVQYSVWWITFDIGLNLAMGWDWNYMGDGKDWYEKFDSWKIQYVYKFVNLSIALLALFILT